MSSLFQVLLEVCRFPWTFDLVKSWEIILWAKLPWYHAKFLPPAQSSYDSQPAGSCPARQWAHELALNSLGYLEISGEIAGKLWFMPTLIMSLELYADEWRKESNVGVMWDCEICIQFWVIRISAGEAEKISMLRMAMSEWPCASWASKSWFLVCDLRSFELYYPRNLD